MAKRKKSDAEEQLLAPLAGAPAFRFVSSGATLLDLACTGRVGEAFPLGGFVLFVGDSGALKTWLSLSCMAEAAQREDLHDYRLVYDSPEQGALMDVERYFGKLSARLERTLSMTVEGFFYRLDDLFEEGRPFIYAIDSFDGLVTKAEARQFREDKKADRAGKEEARGYGTEKARLLSRGFRDLIPKLASSQSLLLGISQTRHNIGMDAMFRPKTRAGGDALRFYNHLEIWTQVKQQYKTEVHGKNEQYGTCIKLKVEKNRFCGKLAVIELPIYRHHGIDDTGSLVEWLIERQHWTKTGTKIAAPEFDTTCNFDNLVRRIEEAQDGPARLKQLVYQVWHDIEHKLASKVVRKKRYE